MSLAVALMNNYSIDLFSDNRISKPLLGTDHINIVHSDGLHKTFDALKVFFITRWFCIAYAGATEHAHRMIATVAKQAEEHVLPKRIVEQLVGQRIALSSEAMDKSKVPDFIVASVYESPQMWIVRSSEPEIVRQGQLIYIGDDVAFSSYQLHARSEGVSDVSIGLSIRAFEEILLDAKLLSVGGFPVLARGTPDSGFKFVPQLHLVSPVYSVLQPKVTDDPDRVSVQWGSAATGGFAYTTVTPKKPGQNGWGVFVFQSYEGKFFHVDLQRNIGEVLRAHAPTAKGFMEIICKETGLQLEIGGSLS
jgi:hypothetical protein